MSGLDGFGEPMDDAAAKADPAIGNGNGLAGGVDESDALASQFEQDDVDQDEADRKLVATAGTQARRAAFGPGGGIGMPAEKSDKFGQTMRRLGELLGTERMRLVIVLVLVVASVTLVVLGPYLLADATNIIVAGSKSRFATLMNM